jgi:flagellar L-ring protein precursor FlgH
LRVFVAAFVMLAVCLMPIPTASVFGQSSSLYIRQEPAASGQASTLDPSPLSHVIAANSFIAVQVPEPRQYAKNDLVTVIIRESFKTDLKASLETEKELKLEGEVTDFIDIDKLLELVVRPYDFPGGNPTVGADMSSEWEGDGDYSRSESMTGRLTARVADVKPNGTLVLEAKQTIIHDKEELMIVITGTCRAADITIDNTVLSTELYDLHLNKQHKGELKKTTRKGFLTKFFDAIFNF